MKTLIIIPAYNESENIVRVVSNLVENYPQYDYIVVNDGSKDQTAALCREHGYRLLDLPVNLGLSGAVQTGMRYAARMGYDAAIQYDGDGQHDAGYIAPMLESLQNHDIVIGSRFVTQPKPASLRMIGSRLITAAIRMTAGVKVNDPTSGMRLYSKSVIQMFADDFNLGPEPDSISYLIRCGARVSEVQVEMHERIAGTSYLTLGRSVRYMANMFISILFVQFFRERRRFL